MILWRLKYDGVSVRNLVHMHRNVCTRECVRAHATPSLLYHISFDGSWLGGDLMHRMRILVAENPVTSFLVQVTCGNGVQVTCTKLVSKDYKTIPSEKVSLLFLLVSRNDISQ